MTIKGWPDSRKPLEPIGGWGAGYPEVGNVSGFSNFAKRLNLRHPLVRGLVGWWPMDEMQGTRIRDLSIYGNHGTLTNAANPPTATSGWGAGVSQRELIVDGVDDYISVPHTTLIANTLLSTSWTISGWVKLNTLASYGILAFKGGTGGNPGPIQIYMEPAGAQWICLIGNGSSWGGPTGTGSVVRAGVWQNLVVTRSGANGQMYMNGALYGPLTSYGPAGDLGNALYIGARNPSYLGQGQTAQVRFYGRTLSATEIAQLYADKWVGSIGGIT